MSFTPFTIYYPTLKAEEYTTNMYISLDDLKLEKNSIGKIQIDKDGVSNNALASFDSGVELLWVFSSNSYEGISSIVYSNFPSFSGFVGQYVQQIPFNIIYDKKELEYVEVFIGLKM